MKAEVWETDLIINKTIQKKFARASAAAGEVVADLIFNYTYIIPYGYGEVKRFLCPESPFLQDYYIEIRAPIYRGYQKT